MRIVCDENVAITPALQATASQLIRKAGRAIERADLIEADALFVRSVTAINAALLSGTKVKFVGTATAGVDHVCQQDLADLGVAFASAAGANANAVAEYVLGVLAYSGALRALLQGGCLGIVGFGHVGQRVHTLAKRLGIETLIYDPWVRPTDGATFSDDLGAILACQVVSLHASLHDCPPWPSRHLLDPFDIPAARYDRWLVNAGRGALVSSSACDRLHDAGWKLCLDTWPDEPRIAPVLLRRVQVGTPHIAGYSIQAKEDATDRLVRAMLIAQGDNLDPLVSQEMAGTRRVEAPVGTQEPIEWLETLLCQASAIERDNIALKALVDTGIRGETFDDLRKNYRLRAELAGSEIILPHPTAELTAWCDALEITVVGEGCTQ